MMNSKNETKVIGSTITVILLILLVLITCTCNGQRLMLVQPITERQIDSSSSSGKLVKRTVGAMECAILKTDGVDLALCRQLNWSTRQQYRLTLDSVSYLRLEQTLKNVYRQSRTNIR